MIDANNLPIIDAHHHLWDLSLGAQPWLTTPPWLAFRYGDYAGIRRNFLLDDYRRVTAHWRLSASVTMEAEWDDARLVEETCWTAARHAEAPRHPAAHVARSFLHLPGAAEELARHAQYPFVKGIRHKPAAAARPDLIEWGAKAGMTDPAWRHGYRALAAHGFHFELQAPWWHVDELLDLVAAFPGTPVVINHAFLPADRSPEAMAGWRKAVQRASAAPQVLMKISGIGLPGRRWSLDDNRAVIHHLVDSFGPDRAMFASNFPVDGLCGSFDTIYEGFMAATADLPPTGRLKLFHDTAARVYRLDVPLAVP
ncbi:MAG: amidohydrolase family protein [Hyphomicrobiaceae bacterium]|nr:amidohydrolase family protein [Hyphomicrobiaceae bacterium]